MPNDSLAGGQGCRLVSRAVSLVMTLSVTAANAQTPPHPEQARLRQVVELLASPEFGGRRGAGGDKAAAYLDRAIPAAQAGAAVPG